MNVLSTLRIVVGLCAGLRAGGNLLIHRGVNRIVARYSAPEYVRWLQDEVGTVGPYMGVVGVATALSTLATLVAGRAARAPSAWLPALGLAATIADMLITLRGNVPINRAFSAASPEQPPADWAALRERWRGWHAWRTAASLVAFGAALLNVDHVLRYKRHGIRE